jgi:hypothetical protein
LVNVRFEEGQVVPSQIFVPMNRQVQLVLRNNDSDEHHFHVLGMPTVGMMWRSQADEADPARLVSDTDHEAHHPEVSMVPFHICNSKYGICPTGEWVHAHADPSEMDTIIFVADTPGQYEVVDPLHPEVSGVFHVFDPDARFAEVVDLASYGEAIGDLESIIAGAALFERLGCVACHGANAEGYVGPALAGHDRGQVLRQVRRPQKDMPAFGRDVLDDDELDELAAFVVSLGAYAAHAH